MKHTETTRSDTRRRIGLLAGWGRYPLVVAQALKRHNYYICCLGVKDHADNRDTCSTKEICQYFVFTELFYGLGGKANHYK